jgi:hypothetical protein
MRIAVATLAAVVLLVDLAAAQSRDPRVADALRVEWARVPERAAIEGYVYNDSAYRIGLVRLQVVTRDEPSEPPTSTLAWVYGDIPARGRWYFRVRMPQRREVLGVTIESFHLIAHEPGPESP